MTHFFLPSEVFLFPFSPLPSLSILCLLSPIPPVLRSHAFFHILFPCATMLAMSIVSSTTQCLSETPSTPHCICSPLCKVHVPCNLPHCLPKAVSDIRLTGILPAHNNFPFNLQQGGLTSPLLLFVRRKATRKKGSGLPLSQFLPNHSSSGSLLSEV